MKKIAKIGLRKLVALMMIIALLMGGGGLAGAESIVNRILGKNPLASGASGTEYDVVVALDFQENRLFSKYGVKILVDGTLIGETAHGKSFSTSVQLAEGAHTLVMVSWEDTSISGSLEFYVFESGTLQGRIHTKRATVLLEDPTFAGRPTDRAHLSFEDYKRICRELKGESLAAVERFPEKYEGDSICVRGRVTEALDFLGKTMLITMQTSDGQSWYFVYNRSGGNERLLEGDDITVYGDLGAVSVLLNGKLRVTAHYVYRHTSIFN